MEGTSKILLPGGRVEQLEVFVTSPVAGTTECVYYAGKKCYVMPVLHSDHGETAPAYDYYVISSDASPSTEDVAQSKLKK